MQLRSVRLSDKYDLDTSPVFISGTQAIVRLLLMQKARDRANGLNTAGYVTGYRGSPLGGLDQQLWNAEIQLTAADILFQPGINEDLAATALWGAQQAELRGEGRFDGVFGLWYGKGPGADRSGDAFRHANLAGTSANGGVIALMGDDHTCESSTTAHQSEFAFVDAMMPVLNPSGVQEIIDYGLLGWELSRYAGVWAGIKCVKDNVESTASIDGVFDRLTVSLPERKGAEECNIRLGATPLEQEARLHEVKLPAAMAFVLANGLNRVTWSGGMRPRLGIAAAGKSYLDVLQALDTLGIDEVRGAHFGIRLFKIGCTWPLEPTGVERFAFGLQSLVVVEEKRSLIEGQMKDILYGRPHQPRLVGKKDSHGNWLFPSKGALDSNRIAIAIGEELLAIEPDDDLADRVARLKVMEERAGSAIEIATRRPYFCAGCPHNASTVIPDGTRAYAGIGCHYMVQWMDRNTEGYTQMGGEGANWIGEAPFSTRSHVFQNIGDGTYNHSGSMAIRAAAASGVNITYKILYNDAVAMTGGQKNDGDLTVFDIAAQVTAEGARKVAVVSEDPGRYPRSTAWPRGVGIHHRDRLNEVQKDLARTRGLSVLIFDQTCAAEKRRRRKRKQMVDPNRRLFINHRVCEGCGDCGTQSNCVAVVPKQTVFGRKREIDQSACNKDFSCQKGFCPSFVTVSGGILRKGAPQKDAYELLRQPVPEPELPELDRNYGIVVTGVGGTGIVTIGAIIGMAAHLENKGCGIIDMAGLAQKGGPVASHIRLAPNRDGIKAIRIAAGGADLVLGGDIVVAGSSKVLSAIRQNETVVVANTHEIMPGDFTRNADFSLPSRRLQQALDKAAGKGRAKFVNAQAAARRLFGDTMAANMLLLGFAWQSGGLPISREALYQAIKLNGVNVDTNLDAFRAGRVLAHNPDVLNEHDTDTDTSTGTGTSKPQTFDELVEYFADELKAYQGHAYARRYTRLVEKIRQAESGIGEETAVTEAVARNLFQVMAYKDEYEVARLFLSAEFMADLKAQFESWSSLTFHLSPPLFARHDPKTGRPEKKAYGGWVRTVFRLLRLLRPLRGTPLDPFGYSSDRRADRALLRRYQRTVEHLAETLTADHWMTALTLARMPERIRGFGPVRAEAQKKACAEWDRLMEEYQNDERQIAAE
ncbi:indolepyruvate ferredoxin oxidoreductase family protein [Coralliovum pocilloporae]|uniref:indolepyruvate ferredoxin oxidoreductase family protein n=1 Tax=Coralliovum pocilloporae TaxID=3066369 RepID=UPI0033073B1C